MKQTKPHCLPRRLHDYQDAMSAARFANPTKFLSLTARILRGWRARPRFLLLIGLYQSAMAPDDYQQGATVKIMFIHVPNAWLSMFRLGRDEPFGAGHAGVAASLADVAAKAAAPIAPPSPSWRWSRVRCGAGRCGAPLGMGRAADLGAVFCF